MSYEVKTVVKDIGVYIGEGPHWDDATQTLLYVDITAGDIHRWNPTTGIDERIHLDGHVGFVIPRSKGGLLVGLNLKVETVTPIATIDEREDNRLNDGKCDAAGRLWAGTMSINWPPEPKSSNFYSVSTDGTVKKHVEGTTISNGMAWTADNKTMFYIDSPTGQVTAYDFDLDQGTMSNRRVVVDFASVPELGEMIWPDGMTIDEEDNIWVACISAGAVAKFNHKTGKLLQKVDIPGALFITSACWGGKNYDELYVTSLVSPDPSKEVKEKNELRGSVFQVTGLGVKGKPANLFHG